MVGPDESAVSQEIARLSQAVGEVIDLLRQQRAFLRQRGMGLPPGTLAGFKDVQAELDRLSLGMADDAIELGRLRALAETTALVNSSLDLDQVLNEVMDTVVELTGAERGYIMLRDEFTSNMEFRIARNLDRETINEGDFMVSRTIVLDVARTGQPVVTTNAQSDPRFSSQESVLIYALRSILCVPLIVKEEVIGVVYADNRVRDGLFGDNELALLVDFANQAAVAIDNARLFRRVERALSEITEMKELMDNVFASITSGVVTTDVLQAVTTCNTAAETFFDVEAHLVLGYELAAALPILYEHVAGLLDAIYRESRQELLEVAARLPRRGEAHLNLTLTPLKDERDITEGVAIVVDDLTEIKRRDATLDVVRRYLPPAMVDNIQSLDGLGLGGERRVITVMFVETRPFHSFPDGMTTQELVEWLNHYLTAGAEAVHHHTGVIDKFMGNEIMGLFNTQLNPGEDHAWSAVQAALRMADDFITLAERLREDPHPYYRIGIHTGVATVGNVGSTTRREFTVIGDTVNLAKRLQENAQPGQVIISDEVFRHCQNFLSDPAYGIRVIEREPIMVKNRRQATNIFEILYDDAG
ncbi:MAG: GAF domain-containing protein [Chloroflexi bacterium]|nr:GAF domain-containing protein [Chloroflexota bacterium]